MPCVLKPEAYSDWLDPGNRAVHGLHELLKTFSFDEFMKSEMQNR
jgi:putative SOS response-associated peptidase YedK